MKQIEKQLNRWFAALRTGDPDEVAALYAADATLLPTLEGDVKKGRLKIRSYFAKDFLLKNPVGSAVESYTRLLGGVAVNSGIYRFQLDKEGGHGKTNKARYTVEARYTFVYQWQKTGWMIVEHHSSLRPGAK